MGLEEKNDQPDLNGSSRIVSGARCRNLWACGRFASSPGSSGSCSGLEAQQHRSGRELDLGNDLKVLASSSFTLLGLLAIDILLNYRSETAITTKLNKESTAASV